MGLRACSTLEMHWMAMHGLWHAATLHDPRPPVEVRRRAAVAVPAAGAAASTTAATLQALKGSPASAATTLQTACALLTKALTSPATVKESCTPPRGWMSAVLLSRLLPLTPAGLGLGLELGLGLGLGLAAGLGLGLGLGDGDGEGDAGALPPWAWPAQDQARVARSHSFTTVQAPVVASGQKPGSEGEAWFRQLQEQEAASQVPCKQAPGRAAGGEAVLERAASPRSACQALWRYQPAPSHLDAAAAGRQAEAAAGEGHAGGGGAGEVVLRCWHGVGHPAKHLRIRVGGRLGVGFGELMMWPGGVFGAWLSSVLHCRQRSPHTGLCFPTAPHPTPACTPLACLRDGDHPDVGQGEGGAEEGRVLFADVLGAHQARRMQVDSDLQGAGVWGRAKGRRIDRGMPLCTPQGGVVLGGIRDSRCRPGNGCQQAGQWGGLQGRRLTGARLELNLRSSSRMYSSAAGQNGGRMALIGLQANPVRYHPHLPACCSAAMHSSVRRHQQRAQTRDVGLALGGGRVHAGNDRAVIVLRRQARASLGQRPHGHACFANTHSSARPPALPPTCTSHRGNSHSPGCRSLVLQLPVPVSQFCGAGARALRS